MASSQKGALRQENPNAAEQNTKGAASVAYLDDWSPALLKSQAYEQILFGIILGELQPGERIDERILANRYRCGLAGIRDALARLALGRPAGIAWPVYSSM